MRFIYFCFVFIVFLNAAKAEDSCEILEKNKPNWTQKDFELSSLSEAELNAISTCSKSLKNQNSTKALYDVSNEIRGSNSSCAGIHYLSKLQNFNFLLLKLALDIKSYNQSLENSDNSEKRYRALKAYFKYWAYQSIGNYRLYRSFWQEYEKAKAPLTSYFMQSANLDKKNASLYAQNALNEFLNWAVGETKIFRDISEFSKLLENKNIDLSRIQNYIYINTPSQAELTIALQSALLNNRDKSVLEILIKFGARINEGYESALFFALENFENTQFLIENGANVNQGNSFGKTPLFYAVEYNRPDIVKLLIDNGANVNAKYINGNEKLALSGNIGGNTPYYITFCALEHTSKSVLMHAAAYSDTKILKFLVSKGANINDVDDLGFNALDFALAADNKENAAYLKSLGMVANNNLYYGGSLE